MAMRVVIQLVEADLSAEGVAMNAEQSRGTRLIPVGTVEHTLDEFLLKLVDRFVKQDPALDHLAD
jgi:hypothetical protein